MKSRRERRAGAVERLRELRYNDASDVILAVLGWGHEPHFMSDVTEALIDLLSEDECEDVSGNDWEFKCSACGARIDVTDQNGESTMWDVNGDATWPSHCPSCGVRVKSRSVISDTHLSGTEQENRRSSDGGEGTSVSFDPAKVTLADGDGQPRTIADNVRKECSCVHNDGGSTDNELTTGECTKHDEAAWESILNQAGVKHECKDSDFQSHESVSLRPESETTDSQEKLEDDVRSYFSMWVCVGDAQRTKEAIRGWLDRQAAITACECNEANAYVQREQCAFCKGNMQRELDELREKYSPMKGVLNFHKSRAEELQKELQDAKTTIEQLESVRTDLCNEIERKDSEIESYKRKYKHATSAGKTIYQRAENIAKSRNELKEKLADLEAERDKLREQLGNIAEWDAASVKEILGKYERGELLRDCDRDADVLIATEHQRDACADMVEEMWHEYGIERNMCNRFRDRCVDQWTQIYHMEDATAEMVAEMWDKYQILSDMYDLSNAEITELEEERGKLQCKLADLSEERGFVAVTDENMLERGWMRLPVDADGETIRLGDVVQYRDEKPFAVTMISYYPNIAGKVFWRFKGAGTPVYGKGCRDELRHYHAPTVADVLEEFIAEYERDDSGMCEEEIIEMFAKRLQLKEEA